MRHSSKIVIAAAAAVLFAAYTASAAERPATSARVEVAKVKTVKKTVRASVKHEYENVAGFKGRVHDPLYSYAAEPPAVVTAEPMGARPVITQWPMPNTVWW